MAEETLIDVARDFSRTPGGRYASQSESSGEEFRKTILEPALRAGNDIVVDLDGAAGFTTSFLEEAFGGLVRVFGPSIVRRVRFVARARPGRAKKAEEYMQRALRAAG